MNYDEVQLPLSIENHNLSLYILHYFFLAMRLKLIFLVKSFHFYQLREYLSVNQLTQIVFEICNKKILPAIQQ